MPIYEKSVRELFRDMAGSLRTTKNQMTSRKEILHWFEANYPKIKRSTITAHLIQMSTNAPSRVHHRVGPQHDLLYQIDSGHFRLYDPEHDPAPIYSQGEEPLPDTSDDFENEEAESKEFAYERDLKNFLAKNLDLIESGLHLYEDEDGITGIEFPVGGHYIDILAVDTSNNYVVIELKVSKGYDRVIGQLLRYMAWIEKHHVEDGQQVRGVIIASSISEDLLLACMKIPGVELFEYSLSVSLKRVDVP